MRKLTATLCLTIAVLLGSAGVSVGDERSYWIFTEILRDHPNKNYKDNEFIKRAQIKISFPGKRQKYFATGWVNIHLGECQNLMLANGNLTIGPIGGETGASLLVKNLPIGKTKFKNNTGSLAKLPLNQKTDFAEFDKNPIHWVDIDGDGVDELVYSSACGNRGDTHHFIYEYDDSSIAPKFTNPIEIRHLKPAEFPINEIETYWSQSSCGSKSETFKSIDGKYVLTKVSITDDKTGRCITEIFKRRQDGKFCLTTSHGWRDGIPQKEKNVKNPFEGECLSYQWLSAQF